MRVRTLLLLAAGGVYLAGSLLLALGAPGGGLGSRFVGLLLMSGAYGGAAAALLLPRRRGLRVLELVLLVGLGLLFRLTLGFTGDSVAGVVEPAAWAPGVGAGQEVVSPGVPPPAPLTRLMSLLLYFLGPEVWIGRVTLMLLEVGTWAVLLMMLEEERSSSAWLVLYVWNPVAVVVSGLGALSSAAVLFLVLGLWFYRRGRPGRAAVAAGLSAAGSYLLWPALVALAAGPLGKRKAVAGAVLAALAAAAGVLLWLEPGWAQALRDTLSRGTRNPGLFALAQWATGSRWAAWGLAGALWATVAWLVRRRKPGVVVDRMAKAALVVSPVVVPTGVYVLTALLVLEPGLGWAAFYCAVALVGLRFAGGPVPVGWLVAEYGVLVVGLVVERVWVATRGGRPRG